MSFENHSFVCDLLVISRLDISGMPAPCESHSCWTISILRLFNILHSKITLLNTSKINACFIMLKDL